jgi:hypothetical protein
VQSNPKHAQDIRKLLFICSSVFVLLLVSLMPLLPVLITNNDSNNNNTNKNFLVPAYSQIKDDESKDVVKQLQPDVNKKIREEEEIEGFICATYTDGTVYCDEQSKTEYENKDSTIAPYNNEKNNDNDNDKATQHERYQPQIQPQHGQEQEQQQLRMTQASNTGTLPYSGTSELTDYRTGATSPSISSDTPNSSELQNVLVKPSNNTVKATSNYEIAFTTKTTGTIAMIEVKFPPGFQIGNANFLQKSGIKSHLFFSSFPSTDDTIKLVANPAQTVGSDRTIRLNMGNIINSYSPGNDYQVSVTTRDAANNIIDGPTVSVPFELKQNNYAISSSSGSKTGIITQESVSQQYSTIDHNLGPYDNEVKETTTTTGTAEGESYSNNTIIVDELKDGVSTDLILGSPVDKNSVRKIEEVTLPCKQGEIATLGGYEIISNTLEQPENNPIKVFVLCVKL